MANADAAIRDNKIVFDLRIAFERVNDTLNTQAAAVDTLYPAMSILTNDASAMRCDLDDIIRTATELRAAIIKRAIRPDDAA
jgi:hypothetical protein